MSDETAYGGELSGPPVSQVFDFLYHDTLRVASFLAQFDPSGNLTGLKQTEFAETGSVKRAGGSAGVSAAVIRGGGSYDNQSTAVERETAERSYDPAWVNAVELVRLFDQHILPRRRPENSPVGSFAIAEGALVVMDAALLKAALGTPSVKSIVENQFKVAIKSLSKAQQQSARAASDEQSQNLKLMLEILSILPHGVQAQLIGSNYTVWASLSEKHMVTSPSDLMLKHGLAISGSWKILGILDAVPDAINKQARMALPGGPLVESLVALYPIARQLFGRPSDAFGMTPILVYREISRQTE